MSKEVHFYMIEEEMIDILVEGEIKPPELILPPNWKVPYGWNFMEATNTEEESPLQSGDSE